MSIFRCENLCKKYGKKEVLKDLNLELESGKIYGLIGRNGAGKTTMLSIMANHNPATSGKVTLDGEDVWENRKALDRICFSRELNASAENVLSSYTIKQYLKAASHFFAQWDKSMADMLIKKFDLSLKAKLGKLSKGMLSMVTIIVALASKAEFTFLDEPVAGLDVVAREEFYQLLLEEYNATGRTFVISTHIIEEAANVFEEVIIIDSGKIIKHENVQELLDRSVYVTGLSSEVDGATQGLNCYHPENIGRSKSVTVILENGQNIKSDFDVTVQPVSLQKIFVALCGREAEKCD